MPRDRQKVMRNGNGKDRLGPARRQKNYRELNKRGFACPTVIASKEDAELLGALKDAAIPVTIDPDWREAIEREAGRQWWNEQIRHSLAHPVKTVVRVQTDGSGVMEWPDGDKFLLSPEVVKMFLSSGRWVG